MLKYLICNKGVANKIIIRNENNSGVVMVVEPIDLTQHISYKFIQSLLEFSSSCLLGLTR